MPGTLLRVLRAHRETILSVLGLVLFALLGVFAVLFFRTHTALRTIEEQTVAERAARAQEAANLRASTTALAGERDQALLLVQDLSRRLGIAVQDTSALQNQVAASAQYIEVLNKLRQTDKELLQKYSKVYFLNENYTPSSLATVTPQFVHDGKKVLLIHSDVRPFLERMLSDASRAGHPVTLISAYRSFKSQAALKSQYTTTFGSGANKFSADQGYSEHQLGTTFDGTTPALGAGYTAFDTTDAYAWMTENAYRYGFVLSYPKKNQYYVYEPWHWRFVGIILATRLHQEGKYFYDLDQRDIDGYLVDIFALKETMGAGETPLY